MATRKKAAKKKTTAKKAPAKKLSQGDKVTWSSLNGPTAGKVRKKITRRTKIKSHTIDASAQDPQYLVESEKTGKQAAHKGKSLRKRT